MLRLQSTVQTLLQHNTFGFARPKPHVVVSLNQRLRKYARQPEKYRRITLIRPPNLRDPNLVFPIKIPMRIRHLRIKWKKPLFTPNTKKMDWSRMTPNEMLLAFQNLRLLSYKEVITGLQQLSSVAGQEKHDWNSHPWVRPAMDYVRYNFFRITPDKLLKFYYLMKKLKYSDEQFWAQMYAQLQENIYDIYPGEFETLFLRYYKVSDNYFSSDMKRVWLKLAEGRLRSFRPSTILYLFQIYFQQQRLDDYYISSVFVPLFKNRVYTYTPHELCRIFRYMMMLNHEKDYRLYESLYARIRRYQFKSLEEVEALEDVLEEVKEIFISHRLDEHLTYLHQQKEPLKEIKVEKKLSLQEIVKQDIAFFMQKHRLTRLESLRL